MDITQINTLVGAFPVADDVPARGYRAPRHLLTTIGLILAAGLLWVLYTQRSVAEIPQLAASFPAETYVAPAVEPLPVPEPETAVIAPPAIENDRRSVTVEAAAADALPAPSTSPAPAAAALPNVRNEMAGSRKTVAPAYARPPAYDEPTITGTYEMEEVKHGKHTHGGRLTLSFTERVNGRKITWALPTGLNTEQYRLLDFSPERGTYLERETGRLFLKPNGHNNGEFTFQPRTDTRRMYEEKGWGTASVEAADVKLNGMQQGVSLKPEWATNDPVEVTWLRYFTSNVGERYLDLLDEIGVTDEARSELWRLPNGGVGSNKLGELSTVLAPMRPLGKLDIETLLWMAWNTGSLRSLAEQGYRGLSAASLRTLAEADVNDYFITRANLHRAENLSLPQMAELFTAEVKVFELNGFQQYLSEDLELRDMEALRTAGIRPALAEAFAREGVVMLTAKDLLRAKQEMLLPSDVKYLREAGYAEETIAGYLAAKNSELSVYETGEARLVDRDFGRRKKGYRREKTDLVPFTSLKVEDEVNVVIVPGDVYRAEFVAWKADGIKLALDMSANGELTIRKKVKFGWVVKGITIGEVRLTVPRDLEELKVKSPARVWIAEGLKLLPGAKRGVLVE